MDLSELSSRIYTDFETVPKRFLGMFYGDNGSGKSTLALKVAAAITPADKKILYVDTSQGFACIQGHPELAKSLKGRLFILPFDGESQLLTLMDAIKNNLQGFGNIGCVVLDEASTQAQYVLDMVVYSRCLKDRTKEENLALFPDYNIAGNKWRFICQSFMRLDGVHFIQVAHLRSDKVKGYDKISPNFQPSVGNDIRAELEIIALCESDIEDGTIVRSVQVIGDKNATAKSRLEGIKEKPFYRPEEIVEGIYRHKQPSVTDESLAELKAQLTPNHEPVEVD